jgi:hypothetical protein
MNARGVNRLSLAEPNDATVVAVATFQVTMAYHNRLLIANLAAGVTFTLPLAVGSGCKLTFMIGTNSAGQPSTIIKRAVSTDRYQGSLQTEIDTNNTGKTWQANSTANANTITLNGTTTGGVSIGDTVFLYDIGTGVWAVIGSVMGSGTIATPFSNT